MGFAHRVRADHVVHRHQAPLAGGTGAGARRPGAPGHAAARLADLAAGRRRPRRRTATRGPVTDRGDASGTGYFSPADSRWLPSYAERALGRPVALPRLAAPAEVVGRTPWGAAISAGTGDNMGAALGMGLVEGDVAVSIGTSGTAYAATDQPSADPTGMVSGFADATGRFLPLACTLNAARVLDVTARMLGVDAAGLSDLALKAESGAGGLVLLPYLDGERTPNRPAANGVLRGLTTSNATPENLARAAVEAVLCSLADAVDCLRPCGITPGRVVLTGGAARSAAVRLIAPAVFGLPVVVPEAAEYVALGAARQAAWALSGSAEPPSWPARPSATYEASAAPGVREQYGALRDDAAAWQGARRRRSRGRPRGLRWRPARWRPGRRPRTAGRGRRPRRRPRPARPRRRTGRGTRQRPPPRARRSGRR